MTNSRDKGKRGERELARWFNSLGFDCRRGQQYCGVQGNADVVGLAGIHVEVKYRDKMTQGDLETAWNQANNEKQSGTIPVVVWRRTYSRGWMVTMNTSHFVDMLEPEGNVRDVNHLITGEAESWVQNVYLPWAKSRGYVPYGFKLAQRNENK